MARPKLTAEEKARMQEARIVVRNERAEAAAALEDNPQFTNAKFWKTVEPGLFLEIRKAMTQAADAVKAARIKALEDELTALRNK